jgi:hypothetical protein
VPNVLPLVLLDISHSDWPAHRLSAVIAMDESCGLIGRQEELVSLLRLADPSNAGRPG